MSLKVAVQMDPIASINPVGDSTFAMMLEAELRGHALDYYTVASLGLRDNVLTAEVAPIEVYDKPKGEHFGLGEAARADLSTYDVVLMRQDPPFDMNYITISHMLQRIHPGTFVVNPPAAVRNAPEKILVTEFPELMPPTLVTRDRAQIQAFRREHGNIIVKPLYGNGGAGVFLIEEGSQPRLAHRAVRDGVPRAVHDPALSARGAAGRQAHHPRRRRAGGRDQPRAVGRRGPLEHACRRSPRAFRADTARARNLRRRSARRSKPAT